MSMDNSYANRKQQVISIEELNPELPIAGVVETNEIKNTLPCCAPFSYHREMGLIPFFITFSINILNSSEIIYIFNTQLLNLNINLAFLITCAMRLAFFIVVSLKLVTIRRFFSMLLLFDSIFIPMGMSIYAYVIFTVYTFEILSPMDYASFVMTTLLFLFYAAYHRIIMVEIYWRKWQLILYKFSLCIAIGVYAIWGIYFIFPGIQWTNGSNPQLDQHVKEFIIFYVITSAAFLTKLFESVCTVDRAGDLYVDENDCGSIIKYNTMRT